MILVDTSVLIDFFRGGRHPKTEKFREILANQIPFGITSLIYQEILQGAKDEAEFENLKDYLSCQYFYFPDDEITSYEKAARMYYDLRKKGITVRSAIDCLIVQIAKENNLSLLHNGRDYDKLVESANVRVI